MKFTQASARTATTRQSCPRGRGWYLTIAALVAIPVAVGCQATGGGQGNAAAPTPLTVAAVPGVDTAPLFIAKSEGAFARVGLKVTIRSYKSFTQELQALDNGSLDVLAGDYADFLYQEQHGYKSLRIIADGYHAGPGVVEILTYPGSGILAPTDLTGKTIATPQSQAIPHVAGKPYSLDTFAVQSVLANDMVDPSKVTWKPMPVKDLIPALGAHKVAAILVPEPYITEAESQIGATAMLDAFSGATANLPLSGYFASAAFVRMHAQAIRLFRAVLEQAQAKAVLSGPVRAELASIPGVGAPTAALVTIGSYPTSLDAASLQRVADLIFGYGMIPPPELAVRTIITR